MGRIVLKFGRPRSESEQEDLLEKGIVQFAEEYFYEDLGRWATHRYPDIQKLFEEYLARVREIAREIVRTVPPDEVELEAYKRIREEYLSIMGKVREALP